MDAHYKYPVSIAVTFLWIGFVCAISFMEAWLKFQAPGVSLAIGLGIGRLIFGVLNKVAWVFVLGITISLVPDRGLFSKSSSMLLLIPVLILLTQTVWLLPALDMRAEMQIQGHSLPHSNIHFYYVGGEFIKVISLLIFGIKLFKNERKIS